MVEWLSNINFSAVYYALTILTTIAIVLVIISENRNPVKSLAWVTVLVLLPLFGIILYIFFGRSIKNTRMISRRNRRKLKKQESYKKVNIGRLPYTEASKQQIRLGFGLTSAPFYLGNKVTLYTNATDKFIRLLHDIDSARSFINIQYYIIADDDIGRKITDALIRKARQGVKVRMIYDHVGCLHVPKRFFRRMQQAGIEVHPFFRVAFPPFGTRINWRNHRKICIIDGRCGYIGGMNIADRYLTGGKHFTSWTDAHIRIEGPAVNSLQYSFAVDWNFMGQPLIEDEMPTLQPLEGETAGMQLITSGPTSQWNNIALLFLKAIASAHKRVYIITPYFLPTEPLKKALQTAALAGVDVRLMMPRRSDSIMLTIAAQSYIAECLQAGIKVYLYTPGMLHSKVMIVDDEFVSVGSTNFDFRSFEHNFESNMQIYSHSVNQKFVDEYFKLEAQSRRVNASQWRKRPWYRKMAQSVLRLLSPVL